MYGRGGARRRFGCYRDCFFVCQLEVSCMMKEDVFFSDDYCIATRIPQGCAHATLASAELHSCHEGSPENRTEVSQIYLNFRNNRYSDPLGLPYAAGLCLFSLKSVLCCDIFDTESQFSGLGLQAPTPAHPDYRRF